MNLEVDVLSWMNDLYQTYEKNQAEVAKDLESNAILLPVAHSTQNAQIEIVIDEKGEFLRANKVDKEDGVTIIPVTEDSASRGNGNNPHPLEDKLEYIAGDYKKYTDIDNTDKYNKYLSYVKNWSESQYTCMQVQAIYQYVSKASIIKDLISAKLLEIENGHLTNNKIEGIAQREAFVRFSVETYSIENLGQETKVFKNRDLFEAYINYYNSLQESTDLCYASGKKIPCSEKHPSKIRYSGDKAKLISANDTSGFTYRGRFSDSGQVASIGYETSQKSHNALRWLINKQGFQVGELVIVAWEISGKDIISIFNDTEASLFFDNAGVGDFTNESYAERLKLAANGYKQNLDTKSKIVVLGLEAATTGRLSVCFYKKMSGSDFLDRILYWHGTCFWKHKYKKVRDENGKDKYHWFEGAPSPKDIAEIAFGSRNNKLLKATIERILPCIIDKRDLPYDIMKAAVYRASNPYSFESKNERIKAVSIACALVRKYRYDKKKEDWEMALNRTETDRSYLYGRLLGAAQRLEEVALYYSGEKGRDTSSERFSQQFAKKPVKTWCTIDNNLKPYKSKLKAMGKNHYLKELQDIYDLFQDGDFMKPEPLSEIYLLGYNCQLNSYKGINSELDNKDEKENE